MQPNDSITSNTTTQQTIVILQTSKITLPWSYINSTILLINRTLKRVIDILLGHVGFEWDQKGENLSVLETLKGQSEIMCG